MVDNEIEKLGQQTLSMDMLRTFVAIADTGSFRAAASQVFRSPSAVSLQVQKLESLLETQLMQRDARRVRLTEQGSSFLAQARRMLRLNDETFAQFRKSSIVGRLCVSAPFDLGVTMVPSLLQRLSRIHPNLLVDVRLCTSGQVKENFCNGTANVALFNDIGEPDIPSQTLFSDPLKWLCLRGGNAASQIPLPIATADTGCDWRDAVLGALGQSGCDFRIAYSSDTTTGQVAAVRADLAVSALPKSLIGSDLVEVSPEQKLPALPITHIRIATDESDQAKSFAAILSDEFTYREPGLH